MGVTEPLCCFCDKSQGQVQLFMGPKGFAICDECVTDLHSIITDPHPQIVFQATDSPPRD